jgi:S1-C subfamily serine protease
LLRPGDKVQVGLIRDGHDRTVTAVLGELAASAAPAPAEADPAPSSQLDPAFEGAEVVENEDSSLPGLLVRRVDQDSPAAESGLKPGDVITKVNRVRVRSLAEATRLMQNAKAIILEVQRGNRNQLILLR